MQVPTTTTRGARRGAAKPGSPRAQVIDMAMARVAQLLVAGRLDGELADELLVDVRTWLVAAGV